MTFVVSPPAMPLLRRPFIHLRRLCGSLLILATACLMLPGPAGAASIITTVAGSAPNGDGGLAVNSRLWMPYSVAKDASGNLYIADYFHNRIRKITIGTGVITTVAGNGVAGFSGDGGPATAASLDHPTGVAVHTDGTMYIADSRNNRIRKVILNTGIISTAAGTGVAGNTGDNGVPTSATLSSPSAVAVDSAGNYYIVDHSFFDDIGNNRIRKVTLSTNRINAFAGTGAIGFSNGQRATAATFDGPSGIAVDSTGAVFISDVYNNRVRRVEPGGSTNAAIATVAGNGNFGFTGDGGLATAAALDLPLGLAFDASNNLYIADYGNSRVRKRTGTNVVTATISTVVGNGDFHWSGDGGPATSAGVDPAGLVVDGSGNLYIADELNDRLRKVTGTTITTVAGAGPTGDGGPATSATLSDPVGIAVDSSENLYVADRLNDRVRKVLKATGDISTVAGTGQHGFTGDGGLATAAKLDNPTGVAVKANGDLFIADAFNDRVRAVAASNQVIVTRAGSGSNGFAGDNGEAAAAMLNLPTGLRFDGSGNYFIADTDNARIRRVDAATENITTVAGNGTTAFAGDNGPATSAGVDPQAVAVTSNGTIYIADQLNHRIRKVAGGTITTVAGTGTAGFSGDGSAATSAQLSSPAGVDVDAAGNLYIADRDNQRIRRVAAGSGTITTVAGNGTSGFGGDGGPATSANLFNPTGVAIAPSGRVYFSDRGNTRVRTFANVPAAPLLAEAFASSGQATVTFSPPPLDGGSAVTGYTVIVNPAAGVDTQAGTTNTSHLVTGLANGTAYTFTVTATNAVGTGPASAPTQSVTPKWSTTTSVAASPNFSSFAGDPVTFTATVDGASPTGSVIFVADDQAIGGCTAVALTGGGNSRTAVCVTSALATGSHSINATYFGDASNAASTTIPFPIPYTVNPVTVPEPPSIVSVVAGNHQVTVNLAPPANNGGRPLTGYNVTSSPAGGVDNNAGSLGASHVVTGLTNGVSYTFTATVSNVIGPSAPSAPSNSVIPGANPSSTSLISSINPSMPGQSVTFTATVAGNSPTGTVLFQDGIAAIPGCNAVPLVGAQAQCSTSTLPLGSRAITAQYMGDSVHAGSLSPTLNQVVGTVLDVDASITATKYDALTDGLLIIRYLFGVTGAPLTNGALGETATRIDPAAIKTYLDTVRQLLDIDDNGVTDALTDGVMILRYLFNLRGSSLINGAFDPLGGRTNAADIEAYIQSLMP